MGAAPELLARVGIELTLVLSMSSWALRGLMRWVIISYSGGVSFRRHWLIPGGTRYPFGQSLCHWSIPPDTCINIYDNEKLRAARIWDADLGTLH
ncbi:hypothetical protein F5888DRAFT_1727254 [Russula emetica]|nr:hypothetical protein F5888DRAFT_1727254 [Russula emetica]